MQGGIRRNKHDLLPRYNKNGELLDVNGNPTLLGKSGDGLKKKFRLTTPMKKLLLYITMLLSVYVFIQMTGIIARDGENPLLLSTTGASTTTDSSVSLGSGSGSGSGSSSSSSSNNNGGGFKNDIAMQQEAANLKNEYESSSSSSSSSNGAKDAKLSDDFQNGIVSNLVNNKDSANEDNTASTKKGKTNANANSKQQKAEASNAGNKVKAQDVAPKQQEQEQILGDSEQIDNGNDIKAVKQSDLQQKSGSGSGSSSGSSSAGANGEDGPRFKKSQGELNKQKDAKQKEENKQKNDS